MGPETASPTLLSLFQWPRFVLTDVRKNTSSGEKGPFLSYFTFGVASIQLQALTFSILLLFSCSVVSNSLQPHGLQHARLLSFTVSWSLFKLTFIELMIPSNHLILCCPLLLPSIFPSIRVLSNESAVCIRWPKYWSFSISSSNEYSGLISFSID